jgi:hypothetical protein
VLDGTAINGHAWVFFASLTDVEFDLVVTDTVTGAERRYHNPQGTQASRADTSAFVTAPGASTAKAPSGGQPAAVSGQGTGCAAGALCLAEGRFVVTATRRLPGSDPTAAKPLPMTADTGAFWFFGPSNLELVIKVLDGRAVNGHFWVFFASLTDVEFDLEVLDTLSGERRTYHNKAGTLASRADIGAF